MVCIVWVSEQYNNCMIIVLIDIIIIVIIVIINHINTGRVINKSNCWEEG